MDIKTKDGKTVSVDENHILYFPQGLFGFELYHNYAIYDSEYSPFMWLQSLDDVNLAFLVVDPFLICTDYELDLDDKSLMQIEISSPMDVIVMTIVTLPQEGLAVTANLSGPIIINKNNRKCMQAVINNPKWTTKYDIIKALKSKEGSC